MAEQVSTHDHAICDYEGTSYRARFWDDQGREYEDLAERIALKRLLPPYGQRLLELGAGFGRLVDLYDGYEQVILLDYAKSGLREAQERLGRSGRFLYVAADLYRLPFAPAVCDTVVTIRVLHHLEDVPAALREIATVLRGGGTYALEYANKRNLKALARYASRKQTWSPFALEPYEFAALNFDFHPAWMTRELQRAGFTSRRRAGCLALPPSGPEARRLATDTRSRRRRDPAHRCAVEADAQCLCDEPRRRPMDLRHRQRCFAAHGAWQPP